MIYFPDIVMQVLAQILMGWEESSKGSPESGSQADDFFQRLQDIIR